LVAKAEGICLHTAGERKECGNWGTDYYCLACGKDTSEGPSVSSWKPHENWSQGGPLIPGGVVYYQSSGDTHTYSFVDGDRRGYGNGPTLLIAAMHALVDSKFGDQVDDPS
jgi:hypothetical protein